MQIRINIKNLLPILSSGNTLSVKNFGSIDDVRWIGEIANVAEGNKVEISGFTKDIAP